MSKYKFFSEREFACPHCGMNEIDEDFVFLLDEIREAAETPFVITSGWRCPVHNKEVGGSDTSSHLKGIAVDILTQTSHSRALILTSICTVCRRHGVLPRIGIGKDFIHFDIDAEKLKPCVWHYYD